MVYCVGLTGSIASGKSIATDFFKTQAIDVINADHIAKALTTKESPELKPIIDHFGSRFLTESGELDRRLLRNHIMNQLDARIWLENYLHPLIRNNIEKQIQAVKSPYVVIEIPLLTNKTSYPYLNRVLLVEADEVNQIERVITRDNCTKEEALALLNAQPNQALRRAIADDILINNDSIEALQKQLSKLHTTYQKLSLLKHAR